MVIKKPPLFLITGELIIMCGGSPLICFLFFDFEVVVVFCNSCRGEFTG